MDLEVWGVVSRRLSEGDGLVCDVQGVDDLYTDPQLHSVDESRGEGDLGRRGMALFFATVDADATSRASFKMSRRGRAASSRPRRRTSSSARSCRTAWPTSCRSRCWPRASPRRRSSGPSPSSMTLFNVHTDH